MKNTTRNKLNRTQCFTVAFVLLLSCVTAFVVVSFATDADDDGYTMFVNDTLYADRKQYPFVDIFGEIYIPCIYLSSIDGVEVRESETLNNLLVSYNGKYITFDLNNSLMYTSDGSRYDATVYLLYASENYIPAKKVCDYLGIQYEYLDGRIRLSDKSAGKTFRQLIDFYIQPAETEKQTEEEQVIVDTTDVQRQVYIIIECGDYTLNYLDTVSEAGISAAFAMSEEYARNNTAVVAELLAGRCNIIYECDISESEEIVRAGLLTFSDYFYGAFNYKTALFTTDYSNIRRFNSDKEKLESVCSGGSFFVPYTYFVKFIARTRASTMEAYLEQFVSGNETAVFLFPDEETPCEALSLFIAYIGKNSNISIGKLSECNIPQECIR